MERSVHSQLQALKASKDSAHQGNAMVVIKAAEALGCADGEWGLHQLYLAVFPCQLPRGNKYLGFRGFHVLG